jgi:hypothetical protein
LVTAFLSAGQAASAAVATATPAMICCTESTAYGAVRHSRGQGADGVSGHDKGWCAWHGGGNFNENETKGGTRAYKQGAP